MQEILKQAQSLQTQIAQAMKNLAINDGQKQLSELKMKAEAADFWADNITTQANMKQQAKLEAKIASWLDINRDINDILELSSLKDMGIKSDLQSQLKDVAKRFDDLKQQLKFAGQYDDHDVIISIYAGAGGTDAQDWAQMLLRMYVRWAETQSNKVHMIDESAGDEAGIKSATLDVSGPFVYGKLKGEHGVHRLVRLSPYNSDNLRQTSFAKVEVMPKIDSPKEVEIDEKDLKIDVYRAGGHGGQSVNTTDSAVRVTHLPTGLVVAIQNERSQLQNKETAMTILRSKLAVLQVEQHAEKLSELKGPNQSAEWGNQIRSYVLHPYKQVKDLRTKYETSNPDSVLDGNLEPFIDAYLEYSLGK